MDSNIIITAFDRYRHNFGKITLAGLISYGIKVALFYGIAFLWSRLSDLFYAWSPHWTLAIALFFSFGFAQVLAFGFDRMLLHLCQGEKASIKDLFYFFVHRFERALFLSLILTALRAFILVRGILYLYHIDMSDGYNNPRVTFFIALTLILLSVYFYVEASLFLSPFLLSEKESLSLPALLTESFARMSGNRNGLVAIFFFFVLLSSVLWAINATLKALTEMLPYLTVPATLAYLFLVLCVFSFFFTVNAQFVSDILSDSPSPEEPGLPEEDLAFRNIPNGSETNQMTEELDAERHLESAETIHTSESCGNGEDNI